MADPKWYRLLRILGLLQTGRPNVDGLSTACNISRRTVLRDIDSLRKSGYSIVFDDEQQRYIILGHFLMPETQFTLEEALALITLCFDAGNDRHIPFLHPARTAAIKLQRILPTEIQEEIRSIGNSLQIIPEPINPLKESESTFDAILESLQTRRSIRIWYKGPIDDGFCTLLSPYQILFCRRSWYVIGRTSLHREVRTFHIGRITKFETTENEYQIPRGFTLRQYFRNAWSMIPESKDYDIVIRFSPLVGQNVSEVLWHSTQRTIRNDDGSVDFHATVSGLNEISWWVLGYGKEAEVLRPPLLREMIRKHAAEMLKKYE